MTVTIPGENTVKDNNWKMIMDVLDIQPKDEVEKLEWLTDAAAFRKSPEEFIKRANQWRSYTGKEKSQYNISPSSGTEQDFVGPMAYSGVRSPFAVGIKIPNLKNDAEIAAFCKYTRLIHEYKSAVKIDEGLYTNDEAEKLATINAALAAAALDRKLASKGIDSQGGLSYSIDNDTDMGQVCGLIGKTPNGETMTDAQHAKYLSDVVSRFMSVLVEGKKINPPFQTYGEYKKEKKEERSRELDRQIDQLTPEEKDAMLKRFLSGGRN